MEKPQFKIQKNGNLFNYLVYFNGKKYIHQDKVTALEQYEAAVRIYQKRGRINRNVAKNMSLLHPSKTARTYINKLIGKK